MQQARAWLPPQERIIRRGKGTCANEKTERGEGPAMNGHLNASTRTGSRRKNLELLSGILRSLAENDQKGRKEKTENGEK